MVSGKSACPVCEERWGVVALDNVQARVAEHQRLNLPKLIIRLERRPQALPRRRRRQKLGVGLDRQPPVHFAERFDRLGDGSGRGDPL